MPRQNRVTPDGMLIAVPDRGLFWGNRGPLLDRDGRLVRYSRGRAWAICVLSFKGRRRQLWAPGRLTELFFLDEATGLAAGHRPCGECRYRDYQAFKRAWADAFGAVGPASRRSMRGCTRTGSFGPGSGGRIPARLSALPDGVMVSVDGAPFLVRGGGLLAWTPGGYRSRAAVLWGHGDRHHAAGHRGRAGGGLPAGHPPQRRPRARPRTSPGRRGGTSRRGPWCAGPSPARTAGPGPGRRPSGTGCRRRSSRTWPAPPGRAG